MTSNAITTDVSVVVVCRQPSDSGVAVVAVVAARYVRRMFASRRDTIMTRAAAAEYLRMVNGDGRHPDGSVVAILTHVCR